MAHHPAHDHHAASGRSERQRECSADGRDRTEIEFRCGPLRGISRPRNPPSSRPASLAKRRLWALRHARCRECGQGVGGDHRLECSRTSPDDRCAGDGAAIVEIVEVCGASASRSIRRSALKIPTQPTTCARQPSALLSCRPNRSSFLHHVTHCRSSPSLSQGPLMHA